MKIQVPSVESGYCVCEDPDRSVVVESHPRWISLFDRIHPFLLGTYLPDYRRVITRKRPVAEIGELYVIRLFERGRDYGDTQVPLRYRVCVDVSVDRSAGSGLHCSYGILRSDVTNSHRKTDATHDRRSIVRVPSRRSL
jgi:hypothetical protein